LGIVTRRATFTHLDIAKARAGLKREERATRAVLPILIMVPLRFARAQGYDPSDIVNQKARPFIEAEYGIPKIVGELILRKHIFHMPDIIARKVPDTPLLT